MAPGVLVRVGRSYGEELAYLVRDKVGELGSQDFVVNSGTLGVIIGKPVVARDGWPPFIQVLFTGARIGFINLNLLESV